MDRYIEVFTTTEQQAHIELSRLRQDYSDTGMYACSGGFVIWADRRSDLGD